MRKNTTHDPALDLIRCVALSCVICVHFFMNTDFYTKPVTGFYMLIMTIMRNSFMICVPLFMMLTGYLIHTKDCTKAYYIKIIRICYIYILSSMACAIYRIYFLKDGLSVLGALACMFSFSTAPYSWYIEMYIGLFLLIPFLNTMYEGIPGGKKHLLIITLLLLTALPSMLNIYCLAGLNWWLMPSSASNYFSIVPDWWTNLYPITYFFLGRFLRDFPIRLSTKRLALLNLLVFLFAGVFNYYRSYGATFVQGPWQSYGSFLITLQAVLIFCLFMSMKYTSLPSGLRNFLHIVSDLSLGAYLTSWVFDQIVYSKLNDYSLTTQQQLMLFPVIVSIVFIGSVLCSSMINLSYSRSVHKIEQSIRGSKNHTRCP